jgi:hypothetical protein
MPMRFASSPPPRLPGDPSSTVRVGPLRRLTPTVARASCGVPPDRRSEIRRAVRLGCRVRRSDGLRLIGDQMIDLSPQGMLLLSDEVVDPRAELVVSFMATAWPIWFDTRATVARVIEGRRPGDEGRALGIRFDSLASVSRLILRGHLRTTAPTVPQRQAPVRDPDPDYAKIVQDIFDGK